MDKLRSDMLNAALEAYDREGQHTPGMVAVVNAVLALVPQPALTFTRGDTLHCGLRQDWIGGSDPESGAEFELMCGAGLGSPYVILKVELADGTTVWEYADIRPVLTERVRAILAESA